MGRQKSGQNLDFVGMSTGSKGMRVRRESVVTEPAIPVVPERVRGVMPPKDGAAAHAYMEQCLRERIRKEVRAELEAEMSKKQEGLGLAKASPEFKEIEPKATASEKEQDQAIKNNSEEVSD